MQFGNLWRPRCLRVNHPLKLFSLSFASKCEKKRIMSTRTTTKPLVFLPVQSLLQLLLLWLLNKKVTNLLTQASRQPSAPNKYREQPYNDCYCIFKKKIYFSRHCACMSGFLLQRCKSHRCVQGITWTVEISWGGEPIQAGSAAVSR